VPAVNTENGLKKRFSFVDSDISLRAIGRQGLLPYPAELKPQPSPILLRAILPPGSIHAPNFGHPTHQNSNKRNAVIFDVIPYQIGQL